MKQRREIISLISRCSPRPFQMRLKGGSTCLNFCFIRQISFQLSKHCKCLSLLFVSDGCGYWVMQCV
ncbi:unnamed protein product [Brassica rapa subsp. trilocularis]